MWHLWHRIYQPVMDQILRAIVRLKALVRACFGVKSVCTYDQYFTMFGSCFRPLVVVKNDIFDERRKYAKLSWTIAQTENTEVGLLITNTSASSYFNLSEFEAILTILANFEFWWNSSKVGSFSHKPSYWRFMLKTANFWRISPKFKIR